VPPPPVLPEALQAAESPVRKWPLIATGVLFLVCGLRILVMAVQAAILYASSYNMLSPLIIMALAVECVLLAVLVPLGISLVRRRNWARIGGAVVSILYVALLLLGTLTTPQPPGSTTAHILGRALSTIVMLGLGVTTAWYLLSPHAKRACKR
jgi:hypothetical protein